MFIHHRNLLSSVFLKQYMIIKIYIRTISAIFNCPSDLLHLENYPETEKNIFKLVKRFKCIQIYFTRLPESETVLNLIFTSKKYYSYSHSYLFTYARYFDFEVL